MDRELEPTPEATERRYPVVDRRRGTRLAALGTRPTGHDVADGSIVYVLPDQINIGGPIDGGHAGLWQPNGMGVADGVVDWEDRHRLSGPKELKP